MAVRVPSDDDVSMTLVLGYMGTANMVMAL